MKKVFVITDPGLDPDDLVNAWLLVKLQRLSRVQVVGMMANYAPAIQRARLLKGVLHSLGANQIPVACGSDCNATHTVRKYEFDFPLAPESEIADYRLLEFTLNRVEDKSLTLLLISGLTDIAQAIYLFPQLLTRKLKEVYIMGGATWQGDRMVADPTASNNRFDKTLDPQIVYDFFIDSQIPLRVLSRHAAYAASVSPKFYEDLKGVNSLGKHLHYIQSSSLFALWQFANSNPPEHRQNRQWFANTFCNMSDLPILADENPWRYIKKLAIYDPLTAMWMVDPGFFNPSIRQIKGIDHQIAGLSPQENGVLHPDALISRIKDLLSQ